MFQELQKLGIQTDVDLLLRLGGLIFARFMGATQVIPFLGGPLIPGQIKTGIPLVITVFLYGVIAPGMDGARVPAFGIFYFALVVKELFVGFCLGHVVSIPFYAVEAAGSFMDTQRGTTFAQTIAPFLGGQASLLGNLYILLFMTLFLGAGGSHMVIQAIGESFRALPVLVTPHTITPDSAFVTEIIVLSGAVFGIGLKVAAPVVVAMLVTDVTLGVVNRVAPNVQVFWLGMPLKTLLGLVIVFFALGSLSRVFGGLTVDLLVAMKQTIRSIAG